MGNAPPYVHLASTRRHSRDRCSQAFPVFHALPLPCTCIILNTNRRTKKRGRPGNEANSMTSSSLQAWQCYFMVTNFISYMPCIACVLWLDTSMVKPWLHNTLIPQCIACSRSPHNVLHSPSYKRLKCLSRLCLAVPLNIASLGIVQHVSMYICPL